MSHVPRIVDPEGNVVCKGGRALVNQHLAMPAIPFSASSGVRSGYAEAHPVEYLEDRFDLVSD